MVYVKYIWIHEREKYPILFYSQLDSDRFEVRKIELWKNGKIGLASEDFKVGETDLGEIAMPELDEFNLDPEFCAFEISEEEFEIIWRKYVKLLDDC